MPNRPPIIRALGDAVHDLREERSLSQEQLAARCGLHRNYLGGIERGERNPTLDVMQRLAGGLEMTPSELLARAEAKLER